MEKLFITLSMIKAIEDCHTGDISSQLQRLKGVSGFGSVNNALCLSLQPVESINQILRGSIVKMRTILHAEAHLSLVKKSQMPGRVEPSHLI